MPVTEKTSTTELLERAATGGRLSFEEGMWLYQNATDAELRDAADRLRQRLHPDGVVTYLVDRNINYTNVCIIDCGFCAFYRKPASPEGYLLTNEQIGQKVKELQAWGGTRILLQGGVHPYLKLDYYTGLLRYIKKNYPGIECDSFSPVEVWNIARIMKMPLEDVLHELHLAGMDGLPGGGAEILDNRTRNKIAPHKGTWESWIEAERLAQREDIDHFGDDGLWLRRGAGGAHSPPDPTARPAGRKPGVQRQRLHQLHLLELSARKHGDGRRQGRGQRIPAHGRFRAPDARQFRQHQRVVAIAGRRVGAHGAPLRRERLWQYHDGGECRQRGWRGRRNVHDRRADPGGDSHGWIQTCQARQPLSYPGAIRLTSVR